MQTRKRFLDFLFHSYGKELLAYAWQRSGSEGAEDLIQETYLRMLQHPDPESIENPRAFLYQIAANLSIDHHRRQIIRERIHCQDSEVETELAMVADPGYSPEDHLVLYQDLDRLNAVLMELPEITRYAFVLQRLEGMSHNEVASRLGISVRNSERYVARAASHILNRLESSGL
jgi:RNA polymerase sigma factor (sigma-70 family)